MLSNAALIHVTTEAEKRLISDIAPHVPRAVVPCGLYVEEFSDLPSRDVFRRHHLGGYDGPLIMFLGRITEKKGLDVLIRAFARVRQDEQCRLVIIGPDDGEMLPGLQRLARELDLSRDVTFLDAAYGNERLAALSSADVWTLSSHAENFGIAVVEAMAAGRTVVISRAVNLAPEIESARAGVVSDPIPEVFAEALLKALPNAVGNRFEETAREFATRYDWSVVTPQLAEMYRAVARA